MAPTPWLLLNLLLTFAAIAAAISLIADEISGKCDSIPPVSAPFANSSDLNAAFLDLIATNNLAAADRAICVGPGSAAAVASMRRLGLPYAVRSAATACCGLPFESDSFDFAFTEALDRVRVPARIVLEMERVVKPGRVGAVLRSRNGAIRPEDLMKAAAPVASLLRFSDVVTARAINGSALVVFKKRGPSRRKFTRYDGMPKLPLGFSGIIEALQAASLFGGVYSGHLV